MYGASVTTQTPSFLGRKKAVHVLSAALAIGSLYLPHLEKQLKGVFREQKESEEVKINVYAFSAAYKKAHPEAADHAVRIRNRKTTLRLMATVLF